jgi:hypothetical protein
MKADLLVLAIEDLMKQQCEETELCLPQNEYRFVKYTLIDFVQLSIIKYYKGAKEHGGDFLKDRDHKSEARNEIIDLLFYNEAR